jgi:hypothetical protein
LPSGLCRAGLHGEDFAVQIMPFARHFACMATFCSPVVRGTLKERLCYCRKSRKYNAAQCHESNIEPVAEHVSAQG